VFRDLTTYAVNNGIELTGTCFLARFDNLLMIYFDGPGVLLSGLTNGSTITHCWFEAGDSYAVKITVAGPLVPGEIQIESCWIENVLVGVYTEGAYTRIHDSSISVKGDPNSHAVHVVNKAGYGTSGSGTIIHDNVLADGVGSGSLIKMEGPPYPQFIDNNYFYSIHASAIENTTLGYLFVTNNYVSFSGDNIDVFTGLFAYCRFVGNHIYNLAAHAGRGIVCQDPTSYKSQIIADNTFISLDYGIVDANNAAITGNVMYAIVNAPIAATSSTITGNIINSDSDDMSLTTCIIKDNIGYVTESKGAATGTGSQQTIAHGLRGTPSVVMLSEGTTGGAGAYQSTAADGTNIYITAASDKTYAWRAEL
jgi:hypothetical protein